MRQHMSSARVQEECCFLLGNHISQHLEPDNETMAANVMKLGGVQLILKAMREHVRVSEVQETGCYGLEGLGRYRVSAELIVEEGGVEAIAAAMETHRGDLSLHHHVRGALNSLRQFSNVPHTCAALARSASATIDAAIAR